MSEQSLRPSGVLVRDKGTGELLPVPLCILWTPPLRHCSDEEKAEYQNVAGIVLQKFCQRYGLDVKVFAHGLITLLQEGVLLPGEDPAHHVLEEAGEGSSAAWRRNIVAEAKLN